MNKMVIRGAARVFASGASLFLLSAPVFAAEHSLTNSDAMGFSSFNSGLNWDDGQPPRPGETYLVPNSRTLRTPEQGSNHTFEGDKLTVQGGGSLLLKAGQGVSSYTATFPDLVLSGSMNHGNGNVTFFVHGNITIPAGSAARSETGAAHENDRRELIVRANLSGSGSYTVYTPRPTSDMRAISLFGDNSAFTGPIHLTGSGKLIVTNEVNLGGNPPVFNPEQLTLNGTTLRLDGSSDFVMEAPNRGIWLRDQSDPGQTINPGGRIEIGSDRTATIACLIGGTGPFAKVDYGTLILTATNTYTGPTIAQQGTLCFNGETNATASVEVKAGAALGGTGTLHCAVTFEPGANIALAGNGYGTLTLADPNGITLENARLSFDLQDPLEGPSDCLALDGPLTLSGANTVSVIFPLQGRSAGTYTLATYPSLAGDGTLTLTPAYPNAKLVLGMNALTLEITGSGATQWLTWVGDADNNVWDTATLNWSPADAVFGDGMDVVFDDDGIASVPVTLTEDAAPRNVTLNTSSKVYTFDTGLNTLSAYSLEKFGTTAFTFGGNLELTGWGIIIPPTSGTFNQSAGSVISGVGNVTIGSEANIRGANTYVGTTTLGVNNYIKYFTVFDNDAFGPAGNAVVLRGGTGGDYNRLVLAPGVTVTDLPLTVTECRDGSATLRAGLWMRAAGTAHWDGDINVTATGHLQIGSENGAGTLVIGSLGRTVVHCVSDQNLSFRNGGIVQMNSRVTLTNSNLNRDDSGTLRLCSSSNQVPNVLVQEGRIRIETEDAFATPPTFTLGKGSDSNSNNKSALDLFGNTLTFTRIQNNHGDSYNGTANEGQQYIYTTGGPATLILNDNSADSEFHRVGSIMSGPLTFIKAGSRTLTIGYTNALSGAFIVSNGTVNVTAATYLASPYTVGALHGSLGPNCTDVQVAGGTLSLQNDDAVCADATITFAADGTGKINLPSGVNVTVSELWVGEKQRYAGTHGATGSGARYVDDDRFTGLGTLTVLHGSGGTLIMIR